MRTSKASAILGSLALLVLVSLGVRHWISRGGHALPSVPPANTFTLRLSAEPETLDWNRAHTSMETYILMNIMEGLVAFDSDLKITPALAQSWNVSQDGTVYTFKLKPGVKWTDGVPLKARDFVYSWKRLLAAETAASYAYFLFDIVGAQDFNKGKLTDFSRVGIHAVDDQTLEIRLSHAVSYWLDIPTFWVTFPLRQDIAEKYGAAWVKPGNMVTLGPYSLARHEIDSKIILDANSSYHGRRGNVDRIIGLTIKDDSTAVTLYEAGNLDFVPDLPSLDLQRLEKSPELKSFPYLKTGYLGFVTEQGPASDLHLRRAISMAIDKSRLNEILHGKQTRGASFVPPPMMAASPVLGLAYDPVRAKEELKLAHPGKALEIVVGNSERSLTLAQYIQQELKKNLGLEIGIQSFDHKTFRSHLNTRTYPLFLNTWSADYPDPDNFLSLFLTDSGNNKPGFKNAAYDRLILGSRSVLDTSKREKSYLEAQKILLEDEAAVVPLYYEPNMALVRDRVHGLELNPLNYLLLKMVTLGP